MKALTFKELVDEALIMAGFGASTTGNMRTLFERYVRMSHEERTVSQDYSFMRMPGPSTFTLVAGQQAYTLSPLFRAPIYFRMRATGVPLIEAKSDMLLERGLPLTGQVGTPLRFELRGETNVLQQPTEAATVQASTGVSADNGKTITVVGVDEDGLYLEATLTIATTPTASSETFSRIDTVRKNGTGWTGTCTVVANDPGTSTVARFEPASYGTFARQLYLLRAPSSGDVVEYDFWRMPNVLENDTDLPSTPAPFSRIHVYDTLLATVDVSRPNGEQIIRWKEKLAELEHAMNSSYLEGQSNMADASYVHYNPR